MKNSENKNISLFKGLLFLFIFSALIGLIISILNLQSQKRELSLINSYYQEIKSYLETHNQDIVKLLSEVMPTAEDYCNIDPYDGCKQREKENFKLFPDTQSFNNYSSTSFIKRVNLDNGGKVLLMEFSGITSQIEQNQELINLLEGKTDKPIIGNFSGWYSGYNENNKQVVIPIKDETGKTVGAVLRKVIE
ncbi:hypothetical protein KA089_00890 [Candidatus Woesebacteria bacterium]|nr:hypothetical protein [Candidatus Woesebacteria bacterium]